MPIIELHNKAAKLRNQIGDMRNKIMYVLDNKEREDGEKIKEEVNQKMRGSDRKSFNELTEIYTDLKNIYSRLSEETQIFIPTDFNPTRFVRSKEDGEQMVYNEDHTRVGSANYQDNKMVGKYTEHDLQRFDTLVDTLENSSYVVDKSEIFSNEIKILEKYFIYSSNIEDVKKLKKRRNPLAIIEIGYYEQGEIKSIKRIIHNRYIDKATFDKQGNLRRIYYNIRENNQHNAHRLVFRANGQFKYYVNTDKFYVEWKYAPLSEGHGPCNCIRAFGDYEMQQGSDGQLHFSFDRNNGSVVFVDNQYYYALFSQGNAITKNIEKPTTEKKGSNVVIERKYMPVLLDSRVLELKERILNLEERVLLRTEVIDKGVVVSYLTYSAHPVCQEYLDESLMENAYVTYLVPIMNDKMPLMKLIYKDDEVRVMEKQGDVPSFLLEGTLDDGHNCDLDRVIHLFVDFAGSGYEGLDNKSEENLFESSDNEGDIDETRPEPISDRHKYTNHDPKNKGDFLPIDISPKKDEISDSEGDIDEVKPEPVSDSDSYTNHDPKNKGDSLPTDISPKKDEVSDSEGDIDEVKPEPVSDSDSYTNHDPKNKGDSLPTDISPKKDEISDSEGDIDNRKPESVNNSKSEANYKPEELVDGHRSMDGNNHLPEELVDDHRSMDGNDQLTDKVDNLNSNMVNR